MPSASATLLRISVRIRVGTHRMAASDDPLFLGLEGDAGREMRLAPKHGSSLRRGSDNVFVLAGPDDPDTNVAHPDLNDPTAPAIALDAVTGVYLRKGHEPIPNVRGFGEMDDRLEIDHAEVELVGSGPGESVRFARGGPIWLGLICGLRANLVRRDEGA